MYVVYDIMQRWSASLGYNLLVKSKQWTKTQSLIANISHDDLCEAADAVWSTSTCTHSGILALEWRVQLVAAHIRTEKLLRIDPSKVVRACDYQISRSSLSDSCTMLFLPIDAFLVHALYLFTHRCCVAFIHYPCVTLVSHSCPARIHHSCVAQSCTVHVSHSFIIHLSHSCVALIHRSYVYSLFMYCIHASHSFIVHAFTLVPYSCVTFILRSCVAHIFFPLACIKSQTI